MSNREVFENRNQVNAALINDLSKYGNIILGNKENVPNPKKRNLRVMARKTECHERVKKKKKIEKENLVYER